VLALAFSPTPHPSWRVAGALAALALGWLPGLAILLGQGPFAVRGFEWSSTGRWRLARPDGSCEEGQLAGATATLGPWILLAWSVGLRRWGPTSRRYALIGVSQVGRERFRALKGRLSLSGGRRSG
jgi:hypothetical protein